MIEWEGTEAKVEIPTTADEWELYSSMKGAGLAAYRLTSALKKALVASKRDEAIKIMGDALDKDSDYGASDTEPRAIAESCLTAGRGGDYAWCL